MGYEMMAWVLVVFTCVATFTPTESARILAVELSGGRSHWNFMSSVVRSLAESGHELTVFTPFPDPNVCPENCTLIDTSEDFSSIGIVGLSFDNIVKKFRSAESFLSWNVHLNRNRCNSMYDNDEMKKILKAHDGSGYDVLLIELMHSECASHVATILHVPVVYLIPSTMVTSTELLFFGHAPNPAAVSHIMSEHAVPRTFAQRFANTILWARFFMSRAYNEWTIVKADPRWYDSLDVTKPSIVFVNSHHVTEPARPLPANFVSVGGVHLGRPKPIPEDILKFIEDSPNGVIYFTFGSVISMSTLPDHILNAFKEALGRVPQRVLWKYEGEMKDKPKNVMTSKWLPQRDILVNPNVRLFISHGGISGIYEAVDAGVPVLGFPFFFDQHRNIDNLVEAGMAISMDLFTVQKDLFLKNVLELVNNYEYMRNAKIASIIFKDRPMSPKQSVVYWTEYVIRHKGAPHLISHALNLTWYQHFLLDVIAVVIICIILIFVVIHKMFKIMFCKFLSRNSQRNGKKMD